MQTTTEPVVHCPKCNSTQISASKKGFSGKKAVAGAVLTGGIGLLAGTIGSNKVQITCLNCGHVFKPGDKAQAQPVQQQPMTTAGCISVLVVVALAALLLYRCF